MFLVFSTVLVFKELWQPWQTSIENTALVLLIITAIFAAQFNRSRYTLLCFSWLILIIANQYHLPSTLWLAENNDWLVLTLLVLFSFLATIKDRSLFSIHGLYRLTVLLACGFFAYIWLVFVQWLTGEVDSSTIYYQIISPVMPFIELAIPGAICGCYLLLRSLLTKDLFQTSLLITFILLIIYYYPHGEYSNGYQEYRLPWLVVMAVLTIQYLMAVIVDAYFLAYRDDLTALPSRRALNQYALSLGKKYTVAMLDIDHFKKFNDTYGHDIGDQVLKLVASKLAKVKGGGRVFRYGGEEFTVVFSRKNLADSIEELERLRQAIADYKIVIRQPQRSNKKSRKQASKTITKTVGVTISIGVAEQVSKQSFEQCLKHADQALYRAKNNGRNNVSH